MNESTLVPREEISDLDWLARNVHEWPAGEHQPWCYVYMTYGGVMKAAGNFLDAVANPAMITIDQWLARRAELQNKPSWKDAPEWANWLAQWNDGAWFWCGDEIDNPPQEGDLGWYQDGEILHLPSGEVLGDWRDTLEKRPADLSEQAVTARLKEATDNVLTAVPELMTDKYKFDPFVSVEDAATAKQQAPKGSGNPILGMVLADLTNRALEGKEKYGEPLLAHNGRNPLWDAYQEALDLAMYLRQAIEEQKK